MRRIKKTPLRILALTLCICLCIGMGIVAHAANGDACASTPGCMGVYYNGVCFICGKDEAAAYNAEKDYYEISNAGQLFWFAEKLNSNELAKDTDAVLTADVDLDGREWVTIAETGLYYNGYGTDDGYTGTFDGQNHVIKNLALHSSTAIDASCGLFGTLSGTVKNLGIVGVTFVDGGYDIRAGAIAGQVIKTGTVRNCYVIDATITPGEHVVGGIAGCVYDGTIENCYVLDSNITATASRYGHIVGDSRGDSGETDRRGTVRNCYTDNTTAWSTREGYIETCKTFDDVSFRTGEIAYLLSRGTDGSVWGQNDLTETGYPVLGGATAPSFRYEFWGQQLNIGEDLSLKYHILSYYDWAEFKITPTKNDSFVECPLQMRFELNSVSTVVPDYTEGETSEMGATAYTFTFDGIAPQCLGDSIDAYITYNDEDRESLKDYTVEQYLKKLRDENINNLMLTAFIDNLLKYGHASEVYTGHNSMTTDYSTSGSSVEPPVAELPENLSNNTYIKSYTIRFGTVNYIKIPCENGETLQIVSGDFKYDRDQKAFITSGIAPTDFDKKFTLTVSDGSKEETITLSVNDYLYAISISEVADEKMKNLATVLYNYGGAADCYTRTHIFGDDNLCVFCGANKPKIDIVDGIATVPVTADTAASGLLEAVKAAVDAKADLIVFSGATLMTDDQQKAIAEALAGATVNIYFDSMSSTDFKASLPETVNAYGTNHGYYYIKNTNTYYVTSAAGLSTAVTDTSNPTIKLMASFSANSKITSTGNYTLDLNDQTITFTEWDSGLHFTTGTVILLNNGTNGKGTITMSANSGSTLNQSGDGSNLTIKSGNYYGKISAFRNENATNSILTIEGGSFTNGSSSNPVIWNSGAASNQVIVKNAPNIGARDSNFAYRRGVLDLSGIDTTKITSYTIKGFYEDVASQSVSNIKLPDGWKLYDSTGKEATAFAAKSIYTAKPAE